MCIVVYIRLCAHHYVGHIARPRASSGLSKCSRCSVVGDAAVYLVAHICADSARAQAVMGMSAKDQYGGVV